MPEPVESSLGPIETVTAPEPAQQAPPNSGSVTVLTPDMVTMTKAEFNSRMAAARREAKANRSSETPQATSTSQPNPPSEDGLRAELEELRLLRNFDRAASGIPLTAAQRDRLEKLYRADKPQDAAAWIAEETTALGIGLTATNSIKESALPSRPAEPRPISDTGAPSPPQGYQRTTNPLQWTKQEIEQYRRDHPKDGVAQIRRQVMDALAQIRVVPGGRNSPR